jgi:hypothetical protein
MDQMFPTPGPELPKPERTSPPPNSGEYVVPFPEKLEQAAPGERLSQAAQAVASATMQDDAVSVIPHAPIQGTVDPTNATPGGATPAVADDVDVIEKEWVEKAKDIVSKTRHNPYLQSVGLTNIKYDYMHKRYGKEIKKLPEENVTQQ